MNLRENRLFELLDMINHFFVSESKMREIEKKIHALRFGLLGGQSAKLFGSNIMNYHFFDLSFQELIILNGVLLALLRIWMNSRSVPESKVPYLFEYSSARSAGFNN